MTAIDVETIYEVPLYLHKEGLDEKISERLNIWTRQPDLSHWETLVKTRKNPKERVTIAMIGKYVELTDSYKSLNEALIHGGIANESDVHLQYVDSALIEQGNVEELIGDVDGIVVPGGFGDRGIEGKIEAIRHAREKRIPYLGICLGMQLAVIEFARNVAGLKNANSKEFNEATPYPVIDLMEKQKRVLMKGATMRLGAYPCELKKKTLAFAAYGQHEISERHRHRYEFNGAFQKELEEKGLVISGNCPQGPLVEIIELPNHPWFLGCQFHPEFRSRPHDPHPLFIPFIAAAITSQAQKDWRSSKKPTGKTVKKSGETVKRKKSI